MLYQLFKKEMWKSGAKSCIKVISIKSSGEKRCHFGAFMDEWGILEVRERVKA